VPRSYPELFRFMGEHGWDAAGPVREVYLVDPSTVASPADLLTEVQIPWTTRS
jgi:effector-binding domain-containing protein